MAQIRLTKAQRAALVDLMAYGQATPAEIAARLHLTPQAVRRWYPADDAADARASHVGGLIAMALELRADPQREQRNMGFGQAKLNHRKRKAIANVRAGKMTVPQAARFAGVPLSGMVGWLKLAKIEIPADYLQPRRKARALHIP